MNMNLEISLILIILIAAIIYFIFDIIRQFLKKESCYCKSNDRNCCNKEIMDYLKKNVK
jgi:hypothetical protein